MFSSLTPSEEYRLTGKLCEATIDYLIERDKMLELVLDDTEKLTEAQGQFPAEDCLQDHITALRNIAKGMRGENRALVLSVAEDLEAKQSELAQASKYGVECLDNYLKSIGE